MRTHRYPHIRLFESDIRSLVTITLLHFAFFLFINVLRLWGFGFNGPDLGAFDQVLWNSAHGDFFRGSVMYPFHEGIHWLGFHFSPLFILVITPFYMLFPHVELLSVFHVGAMSITSIPLFFMCRQLGATSKEALLWAVIYLFNPITLYSTIFSFQDHSLYIPIMALTLWAVFSKRFGLTFLFSVLLLLAKEHLGMAIAGIGIVWGWYHQDWKRGCALSAFGIAGLILVLFVIMPHFNPYGVHYMFGEITKELTYTRYQWLSRPFHEVIHILPQILFHESNILYFSWVFLPFLFLPFFSPILLFPAGADLVSIALSAHPTPANLYLYYGSGAMPSIIAASCVTALYLKNRFKHRYTAYIPAVIVLVHMGITAGKIIPSFADDVYLLDNPRMHWAFQDGFKRMRAQIGPDQKVMFTGGPGISVFFTQRKLIVPYSTDVEKVDTAIILLDALKFNPSYGNYVRPPVQETEFFLKNPDWNVTYWDYPYLIFEKNKPGVVPKSLIREQVEELKKAFPNTFKKREVNTTIISPEHETH